MVRHRFIIKLGQGLENGALPATYNVMLYLAAYDEAENRDLVRLWRYLAPPNSRSADSIMFPRTR